MPRRLPLATYVDGILAHDRVLLSRAITLCESQHPEDKILAREVLRQCLPYAGGAIRVGITGVPGVGKSTFIDGVGMKLIEAGHQVAVLAVDPSSTRTRGSILGDKTRMDRLAHAPQAYIRPTPSSGTLGGVAARTKEATILCEACGFDWILVETVGVGQSETTVRHLVDTFLLLLLPNAGDELQGIKKGIMEMADLLVINKADGESIAMASRAKALYNQALRLFPLPESTLRPQVFTCSSLTGLGIEEVIQFMREARQQAELSGFWSRRRQAQEVHWFETALEEQLRDLIFSRSELREAYAHKKAQILAGTALPVGAAQELVDHWLSELRSTHPKQ